MKNVKKNGAAQPISNVATEKNKGIRVSTGVHAGRGVGIAGGIRNPSMVVGP
jgi:hypothetical protein